MSFLWEQVRVFRSPILTEQLVDWLQQSVVFGYTPQSTKFPERFMSIADRVRRLSVLLKRSAATVVVGAALVSSLIASLEAQDKKKPDWKDAAEYDLYKPVTQTQDPKLWLDTLDKWTKQYPASELADIRRQLYLEAYRQLGRTREAFNAAAEVLRDNPNSLFALTTIVGSIYQLSPASPSDLDIAERATTTILANLDGIYAKENRPAEMSDADAAKAKPEMRVFAQKTAGWIDWTRKDFARAEVELGKAIALDPKQAQVSYWLGDAMLEQNKTNPEKQPVALYHFARAASYEGPTSLPAGDRKNLTAYLNTAYVKYHGSDEGLDKLIADAKSSATPPSGFQIKSAAQIEKERIEAEQMFDKTHPEKALWKDLKAALTAPDGDTYFETNMKDALVPRLKGKLVAATPASKPKELVLAIENSAGDVTLKLDGALPGKMEPGGEIEFEGIAKSFTKDPFMVTFETERTKLIGWTGKNEGLKKSLSLKKTILPE
jgi:tetratricopeptide (TPR) repeat protein